jgi:hypothetical protein
MSWLIAGLLVLGLSTLTAVFIANALTIRRDLKRRVDRFRTRLEDEANAVIDEVLQPPSSRTRS